MKAKHIYLFSVGLSLGNLACALIKEDSIERIEQAVALVIITAIIFVTSWAKESNAA